MGAIAAMGATFASYPFDLIRTRHSLQGDGIKVRILLDEHPSALILFIVETLQWNPSHYPDHLSGGGSTGILQGTRSFFGAGNALYGTGLCFL